MGVRKIVETKDNITVYTQSAADYLAYSEESSGETNEDLEFGLNSYLSAYYGKNLQGEENEYYKGAKHESADLLYTYDEKGNPEKVPEELLDSKNLVEAIKAGKKIFIPSQDKDGNLLLEDPKIIKIIPHRGKDHLFIMSNRQLTTAEAEFKHVEKPNFLQRLADRFLRIFGSRNSVCAEYDAVRGLMSGALQEMRQEHTTIKNDVRVKQGRGLEILQEKIPEYQRQAKKLIKRDMSPKEFEQMLEAIVQEGSKKLIQTYESQPFVMNYDAIVARAMYEPARDLLERAEKAPNKAEFLRQNRVSFLYLQADIEREAKKVDLKELNLHITRDVFGMEDAFSDQRNIVLDKLEELDELAQKLFPKQIEIEKQRQEERDRQKEQQLQDEKKMEANRPKVVARVINPEAPEKQRRYSFKLDRK